MSNRHGIGAATNEIPNRANLLNQLVESMARGEQDALAQLYNETSSLIHGLLIRILKLSQDAEEVLLDVYMKAWKNAPHYARNRGSVQSWLATIARSAAIDRVRQMRSQPDTAGLQFEDTMEPVSAASSPEAQSGDAQRRRKIQSALRELPPEQRQLVEMAFYSGFTHSELAQRLGQPLGSIKSRIRMALLHLRDLLGEGAYA